MQENYDGGNNFNQQPAQSPPSNGKAVASLVLGIAALVLPAGSLFLPYIGGIAGFVCAIVGLVLAIQAKKVAPSGMATAGMILCIISLALDVILIFACSSLIAFIGLGGYYY